jgi:hypothetical protein
VFQASLPTVGSAALKVREDPKALGTSAENGLLQPASSFYKTTAIDCSRSQATVDLFLFGTQYLDLASLSKYRSFDRLNTNINIKFQWQITSLYYLNFLFISGLKCTFQAIFMEFLLTDSWCRSFYCRKCILLSWFQCFATRRWNQICVGIASFPEPPNGSGSCSSCTR